MKPFVRRSHLLVSALDSGAVESSWTHNADAVIIDVTAAKSEDERSRARMRLGQAVSIAARGGAEVFALVNRQLAHADVAAAVWPGLKGIAYPGAESAAEIEALADRLDRPRTDPRHRAGYAPYHRPARLRRRNLEHPRDSPRQPPRKLRRPGRDEPLPQPRHIPHGRLRPVRVRQGPPHNRSPRVQSPAHRHEPSLRRPPPIRRRRGDSPPRPQVQEPRIRRRDMPRPLMGSSLQPGLRPARGQARILPRDPPPLRRRRRRRNRRRPISRAPP